MNLNVERIRIFAKDNYPIIVFFILMCLLHAIMGFLGDDVKFAKILTNTPLLEFINQRYANWSSRIIIESFLVILSRNFILWKILDVILYSVGAYLLIKFVNTENDGNILLLGVLLFLMYPFFDMAGAGWVATTLNYSWCFIFGVISFIPIYNELNGKSNSALIYIISFLSLLYAINQEQSCGIIFIINIVYLIYCIVKKQNISKFNLVVVLLSGLSLIMIMTCPGNSQRVITETARYYVGYEKLGLVQKLYLGTIPTVGIFLKDKVLFTVFYILANVAAWFKLKNSNMKYVLYFNILLIVCLVLFKSLIDISSIPEYINISLMHKAPATNVLSAAQSVVNSLPLLRDSMNLFAFNGIPVLNASSILTIAISIYLLLSGFILLVRKDYMLPAVLFIIGFLSRLVVGFSPTVFASGSRTAFFFYMIIIMISLMLIKELYSNGAINGIWDRRIKIIFLILGLLTYFGVFAIVFVMF